MNGGKLNRRSLESLLRNRFHCLMSGRHERQRKRERERHACMRESVCLCKCCAAAAECVCVTSLAGCQVSWSAREGEGRQDNRSRHTHTHTQLTDSRSQTKQAEAPPALRQQRRPPLPRAIRSCLPLPSSPFLSLSRRQTRQVSSFPLPPASPAMTTSSASTPSSGFVIKDHIPLSPSDPRVASRLEA